MSQITDEIIDRVKSEANIVDVISDYVRLRKTGKNWTGLCPFHDDKRPSMHVEPVKGIFKCFSCGEGGNVFTFLMKRNGWTFPETVRNLAGQLGIEVPEEKVQSKEQGERERLVAATKDAARRFHQVLRSDEGENALAYFRGRGFSDETINRFGLGYAPDSWDWLLGELSGSGYEPEELEKAGLIIKRSGKAGYYDRFRGRALFPIFEATGRLVGFGARRMNDDPDQPKYINSPESPIYNKSRVLYGLFQAKESIRKEDYALFVEGYADVISLHQEGITTAVATCGTAIAREHASLISRYTNHAVLIFDSDEAGERATERGIDVLIAGGIDVSVARLPDGEDPDTFIRTYGADEFRNRIKDARPFLDFLARIKKNRGDFDSPDRQADAIRSLVASIALIPDKLRRELFVNKIATDYHISEGLMFRELERATGEASRMSQRATPRSPEGAKVEAETPTTEIVKFSKGGVAEMEFPSAELRLVQVLSSGDRQLLEAIFAHIEPDNFRHPLLRRYVDLILAYYVNQSSFALDDIALEELDDPLRNFITSFAVERETLSDWWHSAEPELRDPDPFKIARDCIARMHQEALEAEYADQQKKLLDPELSEEDLEQVLKRIQELNNELHKLQSLVSSV
ncbi:MAG: DNA primase [Ignavibacteriae bacterium]|nr:DNA primase [Ignavibacteriota bacterium]MCB9217359.1 DNA primase [Ignavibacteria bacterium]